MVVDLLLIGLAITLEPFPITAFILLLGSERGTRKGLAFILGWLACLVVVIAAVLAATGGQPPAENTVPSDAALAVKLAAGLVLILLAVHQWRRRGRPRKPPTWMARLDRLSLLACAGLAAFLQPWTLVAAGAATVVDANLHDTATWVVLLLYCLLATSSFLYLELYATFTPAAAEIRLQKLRAWLDTHTDQVLVVVFLLLGLWLAGKSIYVLAA